MKRCWVWVGLASSRRWSSKLGPWCVLLTSLVLAPGCNARYALCDPGDTCEDPEDDIPPAVQTCDLHNFQGSPIGQCIPYVEAGWDTSLVKMAHLPKHQLHCPGSFAGFIGVELPVDNTPPRNVIGCTVHPLATCSSLSHACVPFEEGYDACINQSDAGECMAPYSRQTIVEQDGTSGLMTVCCRDPEEPH